MEKLYNIVDYQKVDTGIRLPLSAIDSLSNGFYLMSVRVWVLSPTGEILLVKRLPNKNGALLWEHPGQVIVSGHTAISTAISEVYEKAGIIIPEKDLHFCGDNIDGKFIVSTFIYRLKNPAIILQTDSTFDARFVTKEELEENKDYISEAAWRNYLLYKYLFS